MCGRKEGRSEKEKRKGREKRERNVDGRVKISRYVWLMCVRQEGGISGRKAGRQEGKGRKDEKERKDRK